MVHFLANSWKNLWHLISFQVSLIQSCLPVLGPRPLTACRNLASWTLCSFFDPFCFAIFTYLSFTFPSTSCPLGVQWSTEGYFLLGPNRAGQGGAGSAIFAPHPLPSSLSPSSGRGRRLSLHVLYRPARCRVDSYGRNRKRCRDIGRVCYIILFYIPPSTRDWIIKCVICWQLLLVQIIFNATLKLKLKFLLKEYKF